MNMEALQIAGLGIVAAVIAVILKQQKLELGMYISITTGIIILMLLIGRLISVVDILNYIASRANMLIPCIYPSYLRL